MKSIVTKSYCSLRPKYHSNYNSKDKHSYYQTTYTFSEHKNVGETHLHGPRRHDVTDRFLASGFKLFP